jgi:hypothetical protein
MAVASHRCPASCCLSGARDVGSDFPGPRIISFDSATAILKNLFLIASFVKVVLSVLRRTLIFGLGLCPSKTS